MSKEQKCPQCGSPRGADGSCVVCLLGLGLGSSPATSAAPMPAPGDPRPGLGSGPGAGFTGLEPRADGIPPLVGPYRLDQLLGEGGMGTVWRVLTMNPFQRAMAMKVLKPGLDSRQVIARFEAEREALGRMEHPNIARALDSGMISEDRPFFVMEWVDGPSLTRYCALRGLDLHERLKLLLPVCRAVQHAHQKGVIHRDLKPSNVLVAEQEGQPVPKVIDFGVARAVDQPLTRQTLATRHGMVVGTPEYMSPEQASLDPLDVDTRSDVYSLGVLLYELITGCTPLAAADQRRGGRGTSFETLLRRVREEEPIRPSSWLARIGVTPAPAPLPGSSHGSSPVTPESTGPPPAASGSREADGCPPVPATRGALRALRGELDWIVLRALEKDPGRRYGSPAELAADLERFLAGEPVLARPPGGWYRLRKMARRHRVAFVAAAAVLISLVGGLAATTWALSQERSERRRADAAERQQASLRREAEEVASFLQSMLEGVGPSIASGRDTALLRDILDRTAERVGRELSGHPVVEARLRGTLCRVYTEVGEFDRAVEMGRAALALTTGADAAGAPGAGAAAGQAPDPAQRWARSVASLDLARALVGRGLYPEAESMAFQCLALRQGQTNRLPAHVSRGTAATTALPPPSESGLTAAEAVAEAWGELGHVALRQDRWTEAESRYREALAWLGPSGPRHSARGADALGNLAMAIHAQNRYDDAWPVYRDALAALRQQNAHPSHVAKFLTEFGTLLDDRSEFAEAEPYLREAVELRRRLFGPAHPDLAHSLYVLCDVFLKTRQSAELDATLARYITPDLAARREGASMLRVRARVNGRRGDWAAAAVDFERLVTLDPTDHRSYLQYAPVLAKLGPDTAYDQLRRRMQVEFADTTDIAVAERMAKSSLLRPLPQDPNPAGRWHHLDRWTDLAVRNGAGHVYLPYYEFARALWMLRIGRWAEAESWARRALMTGPQRSTSTARDVQSRLVLAMALTRLGRGDEARGALVQATREFEASTPDPARRDLLTGWHEWLTSEILLREAQAWVEPGAPGR